MPGRVILLERGARGLQPVPRDDALTPVIDWVRQAGELGQPQLVPIRFTENRDEAEQVKRSLYNAARYYCSCGTRHCVRDHSNSPTKDNPAGGCPDGGQRISCQAKLVMVAGHVRVQFTLFDKREARREMVVKYGPDASKWPYHPKARKLRERRNGNVRPRL